MTVPPRKATSPYCWTRTSIPGNDGGSCSEGEFYNIISLRDALFTGVVLYIRPYLHMYARSNELEEKGVVNLNAVNVESNPDMETLLGVRLSISLLTPWY